jgi:hypothetical protein
MSNRLLRRLLIIPGFVLTWFTLGVFAPANAELISYATPSGAT